MHCSVIGANKVEDEFGSQKTSLSDHANLERHLSQRDLRRGGGLVRGSRSRRGSRGGVFGIGSSGGSGDSGSSESKGHTP